MSHITNYLESAHRQFSYYKSLGEKTFNQLSDEQLFQEPVKDINSVAVIAKHLSGNMLSRWTDFLTSDGEKEWRNRDSEFEIEGIQNRDDLISAWNKGWDCLFTALDSVNESNFDQLVYIRNMGHTITDAINRQMCHYSYHIGQIVFLGKLLRDGDWESLSIPKGKSSEYNKEKFARPKRKEHFTDDL